MKKITQALVSLFLLLAFTAQLHAKNGGNVMEININDEDLEIDFASITEWSRNSQTYFGAGAFNAYDADGVKNTLYNVTLTQVGYTDIKGVSFGIGLRGVLGLLNKDLNIGGNNKEKEVAALGMRLKLLYTFPVRVKTVLAGTYNYAPKSLVFSEDLENYSEYRIELSAEPIDGGWVFAGFRKIDFTFENLDESYTLNQTTYAGIKIYF
jgi:hypothetical protein